jgi:hypothetical protein
MGLVFASVSAADRELPIVTGEHWTGASEQQKKSFLIGMATMIEIEQEAQGQNPPQIVRDHSFIPQLSEGLSHYTITTAMQAINEWYAKNPDQVARPVMEVIWFELTLPNLKSQ